MSVTSPQLILKKSEIQGFLESVGKISDSAVVEIKDNLVSSIVSSQSNSLFLWATLEMDSDVDTTLNLPSISKLTKVLKMINDEEVSLKLTSNSLDYKDKNIKFKYHLHADGLLNKPKISIDKIKAFSYDVVINVNKKFLASILKTAAVFKDTNKLYVYTQDGELFWNLGDETLTGSDEFCVSSGEVDYTLDPFILDLDNVKLLSFGTEEEIVLNINSKMGFGNFQLVSNNVSLNYIVSSLTK